MSALRILREAALWYHSDSYDSTFHKIQAEHRYWYDYPKDH